MKDEDNFVEDLPEFTPDNYPDGRVWRKLSINLDNQHATVTGVVTIATIATTATLLILFRTLISYQVLNTTTTDLHLHRVNQVFFLSFFLMPPHVSTQK